MRITDLHCDTPSALFNSACGINENNLHISLQKAKIFKPYIQVAAIWSDNHYDDSTAYTRFKLIYDDFTEKCSNCGVRICRSASDLKKCCQNSETAAVLAVEDARIAEGSLSRIDELYSLGIRLLTFTWQNTSCIGGAFNTSEGLTDFGFQVLNRCFELGIIPDISHASRKTASQIIGMGEKLNRPVAATHSNSYSVYAHDRNLTDDEFCRLRDMNSVVGISMAVQHICSTESGRQCGIDDLIKHIKHYLSLGGENTVCLGCDFDGIEKAPDGIDDISCMYKLADRLNKNGVNDDIIDRIFFSNAYRFLSENL